MIPASPAPFGNSNGAPTVEIASRIRVAARIRPLTPREAHSSLAVTVPPAKGLSEWPTDLYVNSTLGGRPSRYVFDAVLTDESTQANVFDIMAAPLVLGVCQGVNAALFAYGQTGTGKTHTMLGVDVWQLASSKRKDELSQSQRAALEKSEQRGVIPRAMQLLFASLQDRPHKISVSYFEIYNEKIFDLLAPSDGGNGGAAGAKDGPGLDIREDKQRGVHAVGAVAKRVHSVNEVLDTLWRGARNRAVSATDMNEHSSRSHTIFQVLVETKSKNGVTSARLNLVDLAGSEKWRPHQLSEFSEQRIVEMTSINKSLSNLGNCIRGLMQSGRNHIPYRDSKLTRLLQDSLGGNAQTSFVVTVSPSETAHEETVSTLQFADRAKKVSVRATVNEDLDDDAKIAKLEGEVKRLTQLLATADFTAHNARGENSFALANKSALTAWGTAEPKTLIAHLEAVAPGTKADEAMLKKYHDAVAAGRGALDALAPLERIALMEWSVVQQAAALQRATDAFEKDMAQSAVLVDQMRVQLRAKEDELKHKAGEADKLAAVASAEVAQHSEQKARKDAELAELKADARTRAAEVEGLRAELRASVAEQRALKERLGRRDAPSSQQSQTPLGQPAAQQQGAPWTPRLRWEDEAAQASGTEALLASSRQQRETTLVGKKASRPVEVFSSRQPYVTATPSRSLPAVVVPLSNVAPATKHVEVFSSQKHSTTFNSSRHRGAGASDERPPPAPPQSPTPPANVWHAFVDSASGKKYYFSKALNQTTWHRPSGKDVVIRGE